MQYILDEPSHAEAASVLPVLSAKVKAAVGNVTVVTCGSSQWDVRLGYNGSQPAALPDVDVFIPRCWTLANTSDADIAAVRASGQRVGCYTSGIPSGEAGLNWYVEYPAIRSRLMLGVASWFHQLDFFLYYRLNGWTQYEIGAKGVGVGGAGPINRTQVSQTLEVTGYSNANYSYDGEGQPVVPGPDGVLSTLHFVRPARLGSDRVTRGLNGRPLRTGKHEGRAGGPRVPGLGAVDLLQSAEGAGGALQRHPARACADHEELLGGPGRAAQVAVGAGRGDRVRRLLKCSDAVFNWGCCLFINCPVPQSAPV